MTPTSKSSPCQNHSKTNSHHLIQSTCSTTNPSTTCTTKNDRHPIQQTHYSTKQKDKNALRGKNQLLSNSSSSDVAMNMNEMNCYNMFNPLFEHMKSNTLKQSMINTFISPLSETYNKSNKDECYYSQMIHIFESCHTINGNSNMLSLNNLIKHG